jgi:cell division septation protein DedD
MSFSREELSNKLIQDFIAEYDNESEAEEKLHSSWNIKIMVSLIVLAVVGFVSYALYSDKIAISRNNNGEVPLIKADTTPIRERPEDPGGMYIANRDKNIYEAISSSSKKLPKVIRLLPEPEEPLNRDSIKKNDVPEPQVADLLDDMGKKEVAESTTLKTEAGPKKTAIVKQEVAIKEVIAQTLPDAQPAQEQTTEAPDDGAKKALTIENIKIVPVLRGKNAVAEDVKKPGTKVDKSKFKIQLGSFRSEEDVQAIWKKVKSENGSLLGAAQLNVEKADLGAKGLFYRLQVANIKTESEARKICQKLIENKQGCFVVKK